MYCKIRAAALAALLLLPAGQHVSVYAHDNDVRLDVVSEKEGVLLSISMSGDSAWCLLWNHSVAGFTVSDCFVNQAGEMRLQSSHQPDFAAGLGYTEGRGRLVSHPNGGYLITGINEPVPGNALVLRVGSMAVDHRVLYEGQETSLSKVAAGQRVTLQLSAY